MPQRGNIDLELAAAQSRIAAAAYVDARRICEEAGDLGPAALQEALLLQRSALLGAVAIVEHRLQGLGWVP